LRRPIAHGAANGATERSATGGAAGDAEEIADVARARPLAGLGAAGAIRDAAAGFASGQL
jgi:hypothetical protein